MSDSDRIAEIHRGLKFLCVLIVSGLVANVPRIFLGLLNSKSLAEGLGLKVPYREVVIFMQNYAMILAAIFLAVLVAYIVATIRAKGAQYLYSTGVMALFLCLLNGWMAGMAMAFAAAPLQAISGEKPPF